MCRRHSDSRSWSADPIGWFTQGIYYPTPYWIIFLSNFLSVRPSVHSSVGSADIKYNILSLHMVGSEGMTLRFLPNTVKHLYFAGPYFREPTTRDIFRRLYFCDYQLIVLKFYQEKYWRRIYFRVPVTSRIYAKIKSSRIKGVLQYMDFVASSGIFVSKHFLFCLGKPIA